MTEVVVTHDAATVIAEVLHVTAGRLATSNCDALHDFRFYSGWLHSQPSYSIPINIGAWLDVAIPALVRLAAH